MKSAEQPDDSKELQKIEARLRLGEEELTSWRSSVAGILSAIQGTEFKGAALQAFQSLLGRYCGPDFQQYAVEVDLLPLSLSTQSS